MHDVMAKKIIAVVRRKRPFARRRINFNQLIFFSYNLVFYTVAQLATSAVAMLYYNIDLNEIIPLCNKFLLERYLNTIIEIIFDK